MASGHASRINRPNTWLLRPDLRREESPCQHGAVHTCAPGSMKRVYFTGAVGSEVGPALVRSSPLLSLTGGPSSTRNCGHGVRQPLMVGACPGARWIEFILSKGFTPTAP
jgi:hypothetical protein